MFGLLLVTLGLGAFWYQRRLKKRSQGTDECASEGQIPSTLLVGVEQAVLASAATATGNLTAQAGNMLTTQGYPCNGFKLIGMAAALDNAPLTWKQSISFATTSNDPNNLTAAASQIQQQGGDPTLVDFVNLAAVYMVERNRLAA